MMTLFLLTFAAGPGAGTTPVELGRIQWHRGFDSATATARTTGRPLVVLFQEVPGCSTCVNYGKSALSHPLIVEAAESLFVPVAVYNNIPGDDATTLQRFKEPSWNNPVVRVMGADRKELAPRLADDYSVGGLAQTLSTALTTTGATVPEYLRLVAEENIARSHKLAKATMTMHCFWVGEAKLGVLPGVVATRPGFVGKEEVVEVTFDPTRLSYEKLIKTARKMECAAQIFTHDAGQQASATTLAGAQAVPIPGPMRLDKQPKYHLGRTPLRHVPMTELQANRINAALSDGHDGQAYLSPRQLELLTAIRSNPKAKWPVLIGADDLSKAWDAAHAVAQRVSKNG
jgi:hypothetical protein